MAADQHGKTSSSALSSFSCPAISAAGNGIFVFGAESTRLSSLATAWSNYFFSVPPVLGATAAYRVNSALRSTGPTSVGKLKEKLCSPNLDDWRIPPKPPKMRWATYDRLIEQYLEYDAVLSGVPIQQISNA